MSQDAARHVLMESSPRPIHRDTDLADRVVAFINQLPITDGPMAGQRFTLDPWMEDWVREIVEPHYEDTGKNVVREAYLTCARKNAKSYLVSGLLLAYLVGPLAQPNAQIYSAARNKEQAKVVFKMCCDMINMTPVLRENLQIMRSPAAIRVRNPKLKSAGSIYTPLAADAASQHGLGADFFVADEMGEWKDGELWNVLYDSQRLRKRPLAVAISTQTHDPNHPFSVMLDAKPAINIVKHIYTAPTGCDFMDEEAWIAANPTLNTWQSKDEIRLAAEAVLENPNKEANFRLRYLNQRVQADSQFFTANHLDNISPNGKPFSYKNHVSEAHEFKPKERIYLGLDASKRTDLTALVAVSESDPGKVKSWFWKPAALIREHSAKDKTPYDKMVENGWLIAPEGETISPESIAEKIIALHEEYEIVALVYDFNHTDDIMAQIRKAGYSVGKEDSDIRGIKWGNGANDGAKAVNAIEDAVIRKQLQLCGNPLMYMCLSNAVIDTDSMDRRKFVKGKATRRIDGAVALSIALACRVFDRDNNPPEPVFNPDVWSLDQLIQ